MPAPRRHSVFCARLVTTAAPGEPARVLDDLRLAVLGGREPPGTVIPIDEVAALFGVSPIPVREALRTLVGEGLVEHVPRLGYSVAKLTFAEFRELYDVRQALETSVLRAAVVRAEPGELAAARHHHEAVAAADAADDERAYHRATRDLHRALIAPAAMPRLLAMYDGAWNLTEPARPMARVTPSQRASFHAEHARMLTAFETGDAESLVAEAVAHYAHLRAAIEPLRHDETLFRPATA